MPIERLFKRAHTGLDTVNNAIQGERDRFKARWDSLDKRAEFSSDHVERLYNAAQELIADGHATVEDVLGSYIIPFYTVNDAELQELREALGVTVANKQAQFSSDEVATAYNAAKALIADGWDEESVADQMYTAYALNSNEVQEVLNALYEID